MSRDRSEKLDSWKEIASFLGRSVRTARRWEAAEGLPVHRHVHHRQATVFAFRSEVEAWLESRSEAAPRSPEPRAPSTEVDDDGASIAVLPFAWVGPDRRDEYLADGFTEEVIAALSEVRELRVISRTSSMRLQGTTRSVAEIAGELRVRHLLEGAVRQAGDRLRVSVRLLDPARDDRLWAENLEGGLDDVFALQETIARRVVSTLEMGLSQTEDERLARRPVDDVVAWRCLLQARQEALRWRPDAIDRAVNLLEHGLARTGDNAELLATLGRVWLYSRESGADLSERPLERALECARRVDEVEPGSPSGSSLRGWIHYSRGEIQQAVRLLARFRAKEPNDPDALALLANCLLISGRVAAARPLIDRLLSIDPLTPLNRCMPGWADVLEGRFTAAVGPYREMFELDPGNPMGRLFYTWALALDERRDLVREIASGFPRPLRGSLPARIAGLFSAALSGEPVDPATVLSPEAVAFARSTEIFSRLLAEACAAADLPEEAVSWLSAAVDAGFVNHPFLARHDPFLSRLRGMPAADELLETVRRRWEAFEVPAL